MTVKVNIVKTINNLLNNRMFLFLVAYNGGSIKRWGFRSCKPINR